MTMYIHSDSYGSGNSRSDRTQKEAEYLFDNEDARSYPHLGRLLRQGYNFVVVKRCGDLHNPRQRAYALACETICSNGTELLQRRELLTPGFDNLQKLEQFIQHNMLNIMHKHFFGRELQLEVK